MGIKIVSLNTGKVIYEENAEKYFMPASNMKNFTVATALEKLTPDFRFVTSVYAPAAPDSAGLVKGNLRIFGRGDVSISTAFSEGNYYKGLDDLADKIAAAGVKRVDDVSFDVRAGEVLGIYGFMGCGQLELARILFGKLRPDQGSLAIAGEQKAFRSTAGARRAGIAFVPESRRDMLFLQEPVYKNISISILDRISSLLLKPSRERAIATRQVEQLRIRPAAVELDLGMLSGGNQQKVALAKWLSYPPRLLVLCEPTRGMDVGAKNDVIHIVRDLRAKGLAIIVLSTEPETVLSLADRVIVLKRGAVVREFVNEQISKDRLLEAA